MACTNFSAEKCLYGYGIGRSGMEALKRQRKYTRISVSFKIASLHARIIINFSCIVICRNVIVNIVCVVIQVGILGRGLDVIYNYV